MGSAEPRSFSRGKRGCAGTLVFTVFDRDALVLGLKEHIKTSFYRIGGDQFYGETVTPVSIEDWDAMMTKTALGGDSEGGTAQLSSDDVTRNIAPVSEPVYADEIPPFDITISFANEYGQMAKIVLYAVEILNEGTGFSIDNVISERACTFIARHVDYMQPVLRDKSDSKGNSSSSGERA